MPEAPSEQEPPLIHGHPTATNHLPAGWFSPRQSDTDAESNKGPHQASADRTPGHDARPELDSLRPCHKGAHRSRRQQEGGGGARSAEVVRVHPTFAVVAETSTRTTISPGGRPAH